MQASVGETHQTYTQNDIETANESHVLLGGKVRVYKRDRSTRAFSSPRVRGGLASGG